MRGNNEIPQNAKKVIIFTITTLAPAGVSNLYEAALPKRKQTTATIAAQTVTALKFFNTRIEVSAGNINRLDMSSAPMILIPKAIVIAVKNASTALYSPALTPVARAKVSSKVTAKILL